MIVKYFKSSDLAYANRKRYKTFNYIADSEEEQKAVKIGDGARTSVITSAENLCNYVTIGNTRWYVISYQYKNGGQVELFLIRDVVGEFGLNNVFGKIERGYTETFIRNRKELDLNQRLINRIPLIPESNIYGNFSVNTHQNEKWGILYISKPTEDGGQTPAYARIPIPAFAPSNYDSNLTWIDNGSIKYLLDENYNASLEFYIQIYPRLASQCKIIINHNQNTGEFSCSSDVLNITGVDGVELFKLNNFGSSEQLQDFVAKTKACLDCIGEKIIYNFQNNIVVNSYNLPNVAGSEKTTIEEVNRYNGKSLLKEGIYYDCDINATTITNINPSNAQDFYNEIVNPLNGTTLTYTKPSTGTVETFTFDSSSLTYSSSVVFNTTATSTYTKEKWELTQVPASQSGVLVLDLTRDLVDEPYLIYIIPLYNVTITGDNRTITVDQENAFMTFNTAVQYLSGELGYLVDAQIYPYCPNLRDFETSLQNIPVFSVFQTSFERQCYVQLNQYSDVKKEYIKRQYSIMAPDQSKKFTFNYYDYYNTINNNNGISSSLTTVIIKSALKPFSIISSAVIIPENDSLIGKTYPSDLRGCVSASAGFECSISTDQYQQYLRNNSNYEQFFALEREELEKQHNVERVNDATSTIVNTVTASAMGAIGAGALAQSTIGKLTGAGSIAMTAGAVGAGAIVAGGMIAQSVINENLRQYEESLLKQKQDLTIGTIKNLPNQVSRISSFNEIIMRDFYYVIEVYECSEAESLIVDTFIEKYGYGIGVFGLYTNFLKDKGYIRGSVTSSEIYPILHTILDNELKGGIYYYE